MSVVLQYPETSFELADAGTVTLARAVLDAGLRRSDLSGVPICWQDIYVLPEFEDTARRVLTDHAPVHKIIESAHSEVIANAKLEMFASRIDPTLAETLEVES
jgi:hypothetical protein